MSHLPKDPGTALATCTAIMRAEEHRRGVWAPLDPRQLGQIDKVVHADRGGQLTRDDIVGRLHAIARSMGQ